MIAVMLSLILLLSMFNFCMLYRIMSKRSTFTSDPELYEAQIKNLKKIIRLNEKFIKELNKKPSIDEEPKEPKKRGPGRPRKVTTEPIVERRY